MHLDKERDQFQRALRNMKVDVVHQMFSSRQNQIHSVQERKLFGLHGQLDRDQSPWKSCTLPHDNIYKQFNAKVHVFVEAVLCLGGKRQPHPLSGEFLEREQIPYFVASPEFRELFDIAREVEECPRTHYDTDAPTGQYDDERRAQISDARIPRPHHLYADIQRHRLDEER